MGRLPYSSMPRMRVLVNCLHTHCIHAKGSNSMFKRTLALVAALAMAFALAIPSALAATFDTAGNVYSADTATPAEREFSGDYIWVGNELSESGLKVGGDILAGGSEISVADSKIAGNIRAAGARIGINGCAVSKNITAAGQSIIVGTGTDAMAVLGASEEFEFYGTADYLQVYAQTVTIDGRIDGDVRITAVDVQLGSNAYVSGTLYVESPEEPLILEGGWVQNLDYTPVDSKSFGNMAGFSYNQLLTYALLIYLVITLLMAFVIEWLMRGEVKFAADYFREHPGKYLVSGLILGILIPVLVIGFMMLIASIGLSIVLLLFAMILLIVAVPFAIASFSRLIFPKMNRFLAITIVGAIACALTLLPIAGWALSALCGLYTLGFVARALLRRISNNRNNRGGSAVATSQSAQFGMDDNERRF